MKKELKSKSFTEENELCNFVNEKQISQENIQAIVQTTVYDQVYITLYYWVITEQLIYLNRGFKCLKYV